MDPAFFIVIIFFALSTLLVHILKKELNLFPIDTVISSSWSSTFLWYMNHQLLLLVLSIVAAVWEVSTPKILLHPNHPLRFFFYFTRFEHWVNYHFYKKYYDKKVWWGWLDFSCRWFDKHWCLLCTLFYRVQLLHFFILHLYF